MSILRWKIVNKLRELGNVVNITYGYLTKSARIALGLEKSHANDAFCIAGGTRQKRTNNNYFIKFVRKCNRSLLRLIESFKARRISLISSINTGVSEL